MIGFLIALRYGEYRLQKLINKNLLIQQNKVDPIHVRNPLYKERSVAELLELSKERK
jgi:hypothetical protein